MQRVAEWLNTLGLLQYAQRFADNDIDANVLRDLTDADLEKIGVSLGHRKKMLRAIAELDAAALSAERSLPNEAQRRHALPEEIANNNQAPTLLRGFLCVAIRIANP